MDSAPINITKAFAVMSETTALGDGNNEETNAFDIDRESDLPTRPPDVTFQPFPHRDPEEVPADQPIWRVRFDVVSEPGTSFGLDINGDLILGRSQSPGMFDLTPYQASERGVSRQHVLLRPTYQKLIAIDQGSTNGTWRNGRSIGVHMPYPLTGGDRLALGRLDLLVTVVKRPISQTATLREEADLAQALTHLAKAITSQLGLDDVLRQVLELSMGLTDARETAIWLMDEQTNELYLVAEQGIHDDEIRHLRLPVSDTLAGEVVRTGVPARASRQGENEPVKIKTGYVVEAVVYVPLTLEGVTFGVLAAAHQEKGAAFTERDVKLLSAVGDFAAIAVHNARLFEAAEEALGQRIEELAVLSGALSHDLRGLIGSIMGYANLLTDDVPTQEGQQMIQSIGRLGKRMLGMIDQLLDIAVLSEAPQQHRQRCDLQKIAEDVVSDLGGAAGQEIISLELNVQGEPYPIRGDGVRLYRMLVNLVDNAIRHSPALTIITLTLSFTEEAITLRVRDQGEGIAKDELAFIFDKYFQGKEQGKKLGAGLGLAMVQATVRAHEGTFEARNHPDGGAEFTIVLPATLRAIQEMPGPDDLDSGGVSV